MDQHETKRCGLAALPCGLSRDIETELKYLRRIRIREWEGTGREGVNRAAEQPEAGEGTRDSAAGRLRGQTTAIVRIGHNVALWRSAGWESAGHGVRKGGLKSEAWVQEKTWSAVQCVGKHGAQPSPVSDMRRGVADAPA